MGRKFTVANENYSKINTMVALCTQRGMTPNQVADVLATTPFRHPSGRPFNPKDAWHIISYSWPKHNLDASTALNKSPEKELQWAQTTLEEYWKRPTDAGTTSARSSVEQGTVREVEFLGDRLQSIRMEDGRVFTPAKQLVEIMGLDWASQYTKLNEHSVLKDGVVIITIPDSKGSPQDAVGLSIELVPTYMMTLNPNKVKDSARPKVHAYIKDCSKILADVWLKDGFAVHPNILRVDTEKMEKTAEAIRSTLGDFEEKSKISEIAERELDRYLRIGEKLKCPPDIVRAEATRDIHREYGVDWRKLLAGNAAEINDKSVTATQLGEETGGYSSHNINRILNDMGCLSGAPGAWALTDLGKKYGGHYFTVPKSHKPDGTVVQQIKWYLEQIKPPLLAFLEMSAQPPTTGKQLELISK